MAAVKCFFNPRVPKEEQIVGQQSKGSENPEKHERNDLNYSACLLLSIFRPF